MKNYVMGDFGQMNGWFDDLTNKLQEGVKNITQRVVTVTVPKLIQTQTQRLTDRITGGSSQGTPSASSGNSSGSSSPSVSSGNSAVYAEPESFFQKNKTAIMIGGGVVALGIIAAVIIKTRGAKK